MANKKIFLLAFILVLALRSLEAKAVDIFNGDETPHVVIVLSNKTVSKVEISAGALIRNICEECTLVLFPDLEDEEDIEVSGDQLAVIENGEFFLRQNSEPLKRDISESRLYRPLGRNSQISGG